MILLPDVLKIKQELADALFNVKTKLKVQMGDYICCLAKENDLAIYRDREETTSSKWKHLKEAFPLHSHRAGILCPISAQSLAEILHKIGNPSLYISGNPSTSLQRAISEIAPKSVTAAWISNKLKETTDLSGIHIQLLSLFADQQLCSEAKVVISSYCSR